MSTLKVDTLTTTDAANTIATERVANGTAVAWVNFNGTGTVAIRAAYNVSSITDTATGDYTINFANAMIDTNYCTVGVSTKGSSVNIRQLQYTSGTTNALRVVCREWLSTLTAGTAGDFDTIQVTVFR